MLYVLKLNISGINEKKQFLSALSVEVPKIVAEEFFELYVNETENFPKMLAEIFGHVIEIFGNIPPPPRRAVIDF